MFSRPLGALRAAGVSMYVALTYIPGGGLLTGFAMRSDPRGFSKGADGPARIRRPNFFKRCPISRCARLRRRARAAGVRTLHLLRACRAVYLSPQPKLGPVP